MSMSWHLAVPSNFFTSSAQVAELANGSASSSLTIPGKIWIDRLGGELLARGFQGSGPEMLLSNQRNYMMRRAAPRPRRPSRRYYRYDSEHEAAIRRDVRPLHGFPCRDGIQVSCGMLWRDTSILRKWLSSAENNRVSALKLLRAVQRAKSQALKRS